MQLFGLSSSHSKLPWFVAVCRLHGQGIVGEDCGISSTSQLPLGSISDHHSVGDLRRLVAHTPLQGRKSSTDKEARGGP